MSDWTTVATLADLPQGSLRRVVVAGRAIMVARTGAHEVSASDLVCPHRGGPLDEGSLHAGRVVCPWHSWEFDLTSGVCTRFPHMKLELHEARIEGDLVQVRLAGAA